MNNPITIFEEIKKFNEYQSEYWSARQLAKVLEYADYRNFETVIKKAKESCKNSGQSIRDHFVDITDMIEVGKTASREIKDTYLSRYALLPNHAKCRPIQGDCGHGTSIFCDTNPSARSARSTSTWPIYVITALSLFTKPLEPILSKNHNSCWRQEKRGKGEK